MGWFRRFLKNIIKSVFVYEKTPNLSHLSVLNPDGEGCLSLALRAIIAKALLHVPELDPSGRAIPWHSVTCCLGAFSARGLLWVLLTLPFPSSLCLLLSVLFVDCSFHCPSL